MISDYSMSWAALVVGVRCKMSSFAREIQWPIGNSNLQMGIAVGNNFAELKAIATIACGGAVENSHDLILP